MAHDGIAKNVLVWNRITVPFYWELGEAMRPQPPLNIFWMNSKTNCTPVILAQHQYLSISALLLWLDEHLIPKGTLKSNDEPSEKGGCYNTKGGLNVERDLHVWV